MRQTYICILILFLGTLLRIYSITTVPPSLSWDEVAIGYNAWSILKTGKDEYGKSFPFLFQSFDDYKLPGMIYTTSLFEAIFGLNELGVRLPSVFFGVLTLVVLYLLAKEFIGSSFALVVLGLSAINPWLINFSRQAFESNGSMFFVLLGIYLLWKSTYDMRFLILSSFSFVVALYFYYASRIVIPIIAVIYVVVYFKHLKNSRIVLLQSLVISFLLLIPFFPSLFSVGGFSRINQVVVTNDSLYIERMRQYTFIIAENENAWWARILYNRRRALLETILHNYSSNISPQFLFQNGAGSNGLLYLWELPFFYLGFYHLVKSKNKFKWIVLTWLFASPLAGALTKDQPNALRTLIGAPAFILMSGYGLYQSYLYFKKRESNYVFRISIAICVISFFAQFVFQYFYMVPRYKSKDFGDGHKQLAQFLRDKQYEYDTIWISGEYWRPYIHLLFHLPYDPLSYQQSGSKNGFGIFHFAAADWDKEGINLDAVSLLSLKDGKTLFILSPSEYNKQLFDVVKIKTKEPIDGRYSPAVFWAITL